MTRLFRRSRFISLAFALLAFGCGCALVGCADGDQGPADAGFDAADAEPIEVELGTHTDHVFESLESDGSLEIVAGFQGGFHIEPAIRIGEPGAEEFITVIEYTVTDVDSGAVISQRPNSYRIDAAAWDHEPGVGYVRTWERIILAVVSDEEYADRTVRIDTRVVVEEPPMVGTDSVTVELVNEVDELP